MGSGFERGVLSRLQDAFVILTKEDNTVTFMERDRLHEPETPREHNPGSLQRFEMNHFMQIVIFEKSMQFVFTKRGLRGAAVNTKLEILKPSGIIRVKTPKNVFVRFTDTMRECWD